MIIAFSGAKFSGKDTTAEALIKRCGFKRIGLADKLKDICSEVFEISRQDMDVPELKEQVFKDPLSINPIHLDTLLRILQRDGYQFDYHEKYQILYKNFVGKNLTSIRDVLQVTGTDICRSYIKDDIWLSYIQNTIATYDGNLVITDARFKNERAYLKKLGAVLILVKRKGFESKSKHISENQLGKDKDYDVIVHNNSTVSAVQSDICMWYTIIKDAIKSNNKRRK
jgi:hypothetical protein